MPLLDLFRTFRILSRKYLGFKFIYDMQFSKTRGTELLLYFDYAKHSSSGSFVFSSACGVKCTDVSLCNCENHPQLVRIKWLNFNNLMRGLCEREGGV